MSKKRAERKRKRELRESLEKYKKFSRVFYLHKKVSETPLELLEKFQQSWKFKFWLWQQKRICQKRKYQQVGCQKIPLAYAGRLDPMAEGKILILAGEACKKREKYLNLNKEYIFEILLGFKSDSGDILGLVENNWQKQDEQEITKKITEILKNMTGPQKMKYPAFSSRPVQGKPLFLWSLEGRLAEIEIPEKEVEIFSLNFLGIKKYKIKKIKKIIFNKINKLKKVEMESKKLGEDFRRVKVLTSWEQALAKFSPNEKVLILKIQARVSSGTYMRVLAEKIAQQLKTVGLAYSIKRTKYF